MFKELKRLGQETVIYGFSTVAGRLLNFFLLPFYTHYLAPAQYGIVATLYAYIAFFNVIYSYGMDFSFMRHAGESEDGAQRHFSTAFWSLAASSLFFSALIHIKAGSLAAAAGLPADCEDLVRYAAWILALDAAALVPFAELRLAHRAATYAGIKTVNIALNVVLNCLFLGYFKMGVRGVFLATLAASSASLALLTPVLFTRLKAVFDARLWRALTRFGLPLIPAGLASMAVQVIDRPLLKAMTDAPTVGIYQANYRLGIFMMMIVNMFDAAWRPFFLQKAKDPDARAVFARVLTYFVLGSSAVFLGISFFIPDIVALPLAGGNPLIHPSYWPGLPIVPVVLLGYLFNGIYVNFLAPVTLAKRSDYVAYATGVGALVNVAANLWLIPAAGIMGAAVATLLAYAAMAAVLFWLGRRVYPVPYEYRRLAHISAWSAALYLAHRLLADGGGVLLRLGLVAALPLGLAATGFFNSEERLALRTRLSPR